MRLSPRRRTVITASVVLLSGGAAVVPGAVSAQAAATPNNHHHANCATLDVIDRSVNEYQPPQSPPGPIGAFATYNGLVSDAANTKVIGTEVGAVNVLYIRPSDKHIIESRSELWQLPGGTISYLGTEDRTDMALSVTLHSRVVGTSGKYAGMAGWMVWTVHGSSTSDNWTAEHFVLCDDDD